VSPLAAATAFSLEAGFRNIDGGFQAVGNIYSFTANVNRLPSRSTKAKPRDDSGIARPHGSGQMEQAHRHAGRAF
jgi:hypothetical protein